MMSIVTTSVRKVIEAIEYLPKFSCLTIASQQKDVRRVLSLFHHDDDAEMMAKLDSSIAQFVTPVQHPTHST